MSLAVAELDAFVQNKIIAKTTDIIYKNSPVFTRLHTQQAEQFSGGLQIRRPIIVGRLNGDAIGRGEAMDISFVTTDAALAANMTLYYVNISVYGFDAMRNDGPESIFSQVELKFLNASMRMAELLATNMYLSSQDAGRSKHLEGFKAWIDDGNSYASIGGQTRTDIQTVGTVGGLNAYTATLTSFSLQAVNLGYTASWFGADHVDLMPVTPNGWNLLWNATQPLQRYTDPQVDVAKIGFQTFKFNAADVVVDKYMPTGTDGVMYGLNTKYLEWYFSMNKLFQWGFTGFKGVPNTLDVAGQYLVGNQMMLPSPRSCFKIKSTLF